MADTYPKNTIDDNGLKKVWDMVMDRLGLKVDKEAGKGLSTNDYTTTEKDKLAGIASGAEVNTVTSVAGKTGAVELTKSDVGLNNVGNFKAVSTSANQGLTDTEKSNARANIDASSESDIESSKTLKSSVVTVNDAAPINAEDITVDITPQQDLHGYDRPWAGGAGKNKLPMTVDRIKAVNTNVTWVGNTCTQGGVTFEILTDSDDNVTGIKANGTATADVSLYIINGGDVPVFIANSYKISGVTNGSPSTYNMLYASPQWSWRVFSTGEVIPSMDVSRVRINLFNGYITPSDGITFYPMIRLATETDATFAPYSNICPIEGRTGAELDRVGKNWLDNELQSITKNGITCTKNPDGTYTFNTPNSGATATTTFLYFDNVSNIYTGMRLVGCPTGGSNFTYRQRFVYKDANNTYIGQAIDYGNGANIPNTVYPKCSCLLDIYQGAVLNNLIVKPMITKDLEATYNSYEPYQGAQYTADFGETVYGCTVDFKTGKAVVDTAFAEFDGSEDENWLLSSNGYRVNTLVLASTIKRPSSGSATDIYLISSQFEQTSANNTYLGYQGISVDLDTGALSIHMGSDQATMTVADWKAYLNQQPLQVCYELATPYTLTLTPAQLKMLKGTNTLTCNGATITLKYQPDNVIGELKGEIEDSIVYEDFKWTTESSQSYSAGTPGTYGTSSWRNVAKEDYDVIGVTFVENRRFGDCILTLYYIPSTSRVEVIIFRATSSAVTIADEDIEYRVAYKKRT